jgi:hypothetical protein
VLFDPSLKREVALRERAVARSVARLNATKGAVTTSTYVSYRSGKPFVLDEFTVTARMATGAMAETTLEALLEKAELMMVEPDPGVAWDEPIALAKEDDEPPAPTSR